MKIQHHAALSLLVAGLLLGFFKSWAMAIAACITGILMDFDHVLDYLIHFGPRLDVRHFFRASYEREYEYTFVILHAWEWLLIWLLLVGGTRANPWVVGGFVGWVIHMAADEVVNKPKHLGYFMLGRWRQGWSHEACFPKHEAPLAKRKSRERNPNGTDMH